MSGATKIEWSERVWNPVTGCTKVSPGCDNCYAETFAERFRGVAGHHFERGFDLTLRPKAATYPHGLRAPSRIFVNSMSDLFHRDVPDRVIIETFATMKVVSRHTYQVLTKRPERMRRIVPTIPDRFAGKQPWPLPNVWLGVSIESDAYGWRADMLRETPAAIRWISFEPLLASCASVDLTGIDWVVIGGESGRGARWMDLDWAREIIINARAAGAAVFVKQLGAVYARAEGQRQDRKGGSMVWWPDDLRVREYPGVRRAA